MKPVPIAVVVFCAVVARVAADTRYVSPSGSGTPPYTNWATAATTIQVAVDFASAGELILVGDGIYNSGTTLTPGGTTSNRVVVNKAVIVQSANGPANCVVVGHKINNSYAVRCAYVGNSAQLIGLTLSNGFAPSWPTLVESSGAGVFIAPPAVVSNCIITCCESRGKGGGACLNGGGLLTHCTLTTNTSTSWVGGGVYLNNGGEVRNCTIRNNLGYTGGGVYCNTNGVIADSTIADNNHGGVYLRVAGLLTNCVVAQNWSGEEAGGVQGQYGGRIIGCTIVSNESFNSGGGGAQSYYGPLFIDNCTIAYNTCTNTSSNSGGGGVMLLSGGWIEDSVIRDNFGENGGGIFIGINTSSINIVRTRIDHNRAQKYGGGVHGSGAGVATPVYFSTCTICNNSASNDGAGVNYSINIELRDCLFTNNLTFKSGGGIYLDDYNSSATTLVRGCVLAYNTAYGSGGGLYVNRAMVQHSLIYNNFATNYGGAFVQRATLRNCEVMFNRAQSIAGVIALTTSLVENCTICDNTAASSNSIGGLSIRSGSLARNTIVYYNTPRDIQNGYGGSSGVVYFAHCCLATNFTSGANVFANPMFNNHAGYDYRLLEGSPCVNAGTNQPWMFQPYPNGVDIYGNPRVQELIVDIGAVEGVIPEPLTAFLVVCAVVVLRKRCPF
jgi:predicted outer membrane repeat protein